MHDELLRHAATWVRSRCLARSIPIVKLSPADVKAGKAGVCGHVDYTLATGDGTHTDPGPNFPWDIVISRARSSQTEEIDLTPDEHNMLDQVSNQTTSAWPSFLDPSVKLTLVDFARANNELITKQGAQIAALLAKADGASADEVAAKLLPALSSAMATAVAKLDVSQLDKLSDEDVSRIVNATVTHAGELLTGRAT
jgi:hypothetical protein